MRDGGAAAVEPVEHGGEVRAPERAGRGTVEHDHRRVGVLIDDQARTAIALAVDEAHAGAAGEERIALAARDGRGDARAHPRGVDGRARVVEDAGAERRLGVRERQRDRPVLVDEEDVVAGRGGEGGGG